MLRLKNQTDGRVLGFSSSILSKPQNTHWVPFDDDTDQEYDREQLLKLSASGMADRDIVRNIEAAKAEKRAADSSSSEPEVNSPLSEPEAPKRRRGRPRKAVKNGEDVG